jgi:hypothetical protein
VPGGKARHASPTWVVSHVRHRAALPHRIFCPDEVCVDVEVGVGDDAEVVVLLAVEVEGVAVAAGEARVVARGAREDVAHTHTIYIYIAS